MVPVKLIRGDDQTSLSLFAVGTMTLKGVPGSRAQGRSMSRHVGEVHSAPPPAERRFSLAAAVRLRTNRIRPPPSRRSPRSRRFVRPSAIPRDAVGKRAALGQRFKSYHDRLGDVFPRWKVGHRLTESSQRKDIPLGACAAAAAAGKASRKEFSPSLPAYMKGSRHVKRLDVL